MKEKLDLVLEYQNLPDDDEGEWLRKKDLHSEHIPLFKHEITTLMADKSGGKDKRI